MSAENLEGKNFLGEVNGDGLLLAVFCSLSLIGKRKQKPQRGRESCDGEGEGVFIEEIKGKLDNYRNYTPRGRKRELVLGIIVRKLLVIILLGE